MGNLQVLNPITLLFQYVYMISYTDHTIPQC